MKNAFALACVLLLPLAALPGCTTSPPPKDNLATAKTAKNDPRRLGLELVRQATDAKHYWDGLQQLNADLQENPAVRDRHQLTPGLRTFLQSEAGLADDELQEVDSPTYRRADAHYLAQCFLLRDALRGLEVSGMPPEELAGQALAWVNRHVVLHEQGDDWLPPMEVLQRGYGSPRDRGRVFLAMLRQIPMEGCAIVLPEAPDDIVLIGAFAPASRDKLYLYDPRHGSAVRTSDGKLATLKDAQRDAGLLADAGLDAKKLATAQVRLACPLNALPARIDHLERALQVLDRVVLHCDPASLKADFTRLTQRPVQIWNARVRDGRIASSPTRALRLFLPPEEGGIDKTDRRMRFQSELAPWPAVLHALGQLNLASNQLPDPAWKFLLNVMDDLFKKYDVQPHEMLLHGKGEDGMRRVSRAQLFFDDENLDNLANDPAFPRAVAEWREKLQRVYTALANKEPGAQAAVNSFWAEDQFLLTLLHTEGEDRLNNPLAGQDRQKPPQKTTTTAIVAYAARDHLKQRAMWLRAMVWQDKAVRDQARADREQDKTKREQRQKSLHGTWANTRVAWNQIKDCAAVSPAGRQQRLEAIRNLLKRSDRRSAVDAAQQLAALQLELHQHYAGNMHYARAVLHLDGAKAAIPILRRIDDDLAALTAKGTSGDTGLQGDVTEAVARLRAVSAPAFLIHATELLGGDWAPAGNYYWIRQGIARQIALWEKS